MVQYNSKLDKKKLENIYSFWGFVVTTKKDQKLM